VRDEAEGADNGDDDEEIPRLIFRRDKIDLEIDAGSFDGEDKVEDLDLVGDKRESEEFADDEDDGDEDEEFELRLLLAFGG
jgi:hypothetical protein